jgi:hypothetical protein
MIHIGTVHLNGREYSLELNRSDNSEREFNNDSAKRVTRKVSVGRSEVVPLNPNRRVIGAHNRPNRTLQSIEELRRLAPLARKEQAHAAPLSSRWRTDRERIMKAVCRFLSWCFPVREFRSPFQRILYLSMERPKPKYGRRVLLP